MPDEARLILALSTLNIAATVFSLFYAIFWGLVANAQIRWKAFDWPLALAGRRFAQYRPSRRRLWQSLWYLTILPMTLFVVLSVPFILARPPRGLAWLVAAVVMAILAAHAAFAPYRLWLAKMEDDPETFYYPVPGSPGRYTSQPQGDSFPSHDLRRRWAPRNRCVAQWYLLVGLFAALADLALSYVM